MSQHGREGTVRFQQVRFGALQEMKVRTADAAQTIAKSNPALGCGRCGNLSEIERSKPGEESARKQAARQGAREIERYGSSIDKSFQGAAPGFVGFMGINTFTGGPAAEEKGAGEHRAHHA